MEISFSEQAQEPQDDRSVAQLVEEIGRKLKTHDDAAEHSQLWRDVAGVFALLLGPIAFTASQWRRRWLPGSWASSFSAWRSSSSASRCFSGSLSSAAHIPSGSTAGCGPRSSAGSASS